VFTLRTKYGLYGFLFLAGMVCLAFAGYQQHYSRLISTGHRAVAEQRFDSQAYERASQFWLARQDRLLFNRGVLAYQAQNLPRAAQYFRQVSHDTTSAALRVQALHNLGMVMVALKEAKGAAHMFKEALRLNPEDMRSKFHLERLYHFVLRSQDQLSEASLQQAPGPAQDPAQQTGKAGQGRGKARAGL
jgi:tetratricopeptide (TPR) repeat protein